MTIIPRLLGPILINGAQDRDKMFLVAGWLAESKLLVVLLVFEM